MPISLGILLGFANVIVVAIAMGAMTNRTLEIANAVMMYGTVPGVITGALLGGLADCTSGLPAWPRRLILIVPAIIVVLWLGTKFRIQELVPHASIPTIVGCLILERRTRFGPPLPTAALR